MYETKTTFFNDIAIHFGSPDCEFDDGATVRL